MQRVEVDARAVGRPRSVSFVPLFPKPQVAQVPPGAEVGEKLPAIHTLCDREATRTFRNGVIVFFLG